MKRAVGCCGNAHTARKAICPIGLMRRRSIVGNVTSGPPASGAAAAPRDQALQSSRVCNPKAPAAQSSTRKRAEAIDLPAL